MLGAGRSRRAGASRAGAERQAQSSTRYGRSLTPCRARTLPASRRLARRTTPPQRRRHRACIPRAPTRPMLDLGLLRSQEPGLQRVLDDVSHAPVRARRLDLDRPIELVVQLECCLHGTQYAGLLGNLLGEPNRVPRESRSKSSKTGYEIMLSESDARRRNRKRSRRRGRAPCGGSELPRRLASLTWSATNRSTSAASASSHSASSRSSSRRSPRAALPRAVRPQGVARLAAGVLVSGARRAARIRTADFERADDAGQRDHAHRVQAAGLETGNRRLVQPDAVAELPLRQPRGDPCWPGAPPGRGSATLAAPPDRRGRPTTINSPKQHDGDRSSAAHPAIACGCLPAYPATAGRGHSRGPGRLPRAGASSRRPGPAPAGLGQLLRMPATRIAARAGRKTADFRAYERPGAHEHCRCGIDAGLR